MKKFIFISSLLAAFTLGVNAATVLTTTIEKVSQTTSISDVTVYNEATTGVSVGSTTLALVDKDGTAIGLRASSENTKPAGTTTNFLSPDVKLGSSSSNANSWTATFSYSNISGISRISSVALDLGLFSENGDWQTEKASWTGFLNFEVSFINVTDGLNASLGSFSATYGNSTTAFTGNGEQTWQVISTMGTSAVDLTNVSNLQVSVKVSSTSLSKDTYVGLTSLAFVGSVIPEPSMFGLLAGTLALGLAGTRRRRRGNVKI